MATALAPVGQPGQVTAATAATGFVNAMVSLVVVDVAQPPCHFPLKNRLLCYIRQDASGTWECQRTAGQDWGCHRVSDVGLVHHR